MENSKLIDVLSTFSKAELRELQQFISSPFFNKNEELVKFYAYLKKIAPHFPLKKIERRRVYKSLFSEQDYDDKHMNYLMSYLLKLTEQYIGYKQYVTHPTLPKYHTINALIDRDLDKHYRYNLKRTTDQLEKQAYRNAAFYYQKYLLADAENRYFLRQQVRKKDIRLQRAAENFDVYYLANKLKYSCELLDRNQIFSTDYQLQLTSEITQYLSRHSHEKVPPIQIYYQIYLMLTQADGSIHFEQLNSLIEKYFYQFPIAEIKEFYGYVINFCIRQNNKGINFFEELFDRYIFGLERGLLFENDRLPHTTYKNISKVGLLLRKFDWTEQMISDYKNKLSPEFRETAFNYSMADLFYYKKEFDKAQTYLMQVETTDIFYNLDARKMLMKIYYEQGETEALLSLIAASQIFLKRSKQISPNIRKAYQNFMKIVQYSARHPPQNKATLLNKIKTTQPVLEKSWLLKMLK